MIGQSRTRLFDFSRRGEGESGEREEGGGVGGGGGEGGVGLKCQRGSSLHNFPLRFPRP